MAKRAPMATGDAAAGHARMTGAVTGRPDMDGLQVLAHEHRTRASRPSDPGYRRQVPERTRLAPGRARRALLPRSRPKTRGGAGIRDQGCLLYTSPSPRD